MRTRLLVAATLLSALGIGYVMQSRGEGTLPELAGPIGLSHIQMTSSAGAGGPSDMDSTPSWVTVYPEKEDALMRQSTPKEPVPLQARAEVLPQSHAPLSRPQPVAVDTDCSVTLSATPIAGAMVDLALDAPCHRNSDVTFRHAGMIVSERTGADGTLDVTLPALAESARFTAAFADGSETAAEAEVSSVPFYDRVVLQWQGTPGLQLHALEFGSEYFSDGHIWADHTGDIVTAARGEGGFMTRVGRQDGPASHAAEIYTFPALTATRSGEIRLSIEAEITEQNCGTEVDARTLQIRQEGRLTSRDIALEMPPCEQAGGFLVLKNIVEDLKIAAR